MYCTIKPTTRQSTHARRHMPGLRNSSRTHPVDGGQQVPFWSPTRPRAVSPDTGRAPTEFCHSVRTLCLPLVRVVRRANVAASSVHKRHVILDFVPLPRVTWGTGGLQEAGEAGTSRRRCARAFTRTWWFAQAAAVAAAVHTFPCAHVLWMAITASHGRRRDRYWCRRLPGCCSTAGWHWQRRVSTLHGCGGACRRERSRCCEQYSHARRSVHMASPTIWRSGHATVTTQRAV